MSSVLPDPIYRTELLPGGYRGYLRFKPDGIVFAASVSDPSEAHQVREWLGEPGRYECSGPYILNGTEITFTTITPASFDPRDGYSSEEIKIDYVGSFSGEEIVLEVHSHLTDYRSTEKYTLCD